MNLSSEYKRLFFGFEIIAPWPHDYPSGRILKETDRHLTIAFLGRQHFKKIQEIIPFLPVPSFEFAPLGNLKELLFLPPKHPHVVALKVDFLNELKAVENFQKNFGTTLCQLGFTLQEHPQFLPHVTLARSPFNPDDWKKSNLSLPCYLKNYHLYESLGQLIYSPVWTYPISAPFEEIVHTADIAFRIYGKNLEQIRLHACWALFFKAPSLQNYWNRATPCRSLDDIILELNELITLGDIEEGIPLKAVSYHGELLHKNDFYQWEMIIDV